MHKRDNTKSVNLTKKVLCDGSISLKRHQGGIFPWLLECFFPQKSMRCIISASLGNITEKPTSYRPDYLRVHRGLARSCLGLSCTVAN